MPETWWERKKAAIYTTFSPFDQTKFPPFALFRSYYYPFSSWPSALFVPAALALFVMFNGSQFINFARVNENHDTELKATDNTIGINFPPTTFAFYDPVIQDTFYDESYFTVTMSQCTRQPNANGSYLSSVMLDYSCSALTLATDPADASGFAVPTTARLVASSTHTGYSFVRLTVNKCVNSTANTTDIINAAAAANTTAVLPVVCTSAANIDAVLARGSFRFSYDSDFSDLATFRNRRSVTRVYEYNSQRWYPTSVPSGLISVRNVYFRWNKLILPPSYFGDIVNESYTIPWREDDAFAEPANTTMRTTVSDTVTTLNITTVPFRVNRTEIYNVTDPECLISWGLPSRNCPATETIITDVTLLEDAAWVTENSTFQTTTTVISRQYLTVSPAQITTNTTTTITNHSANLTTLGVDAVVLACGFDPSKLNPLGPSISEQETDYVFPASSGDRTFNQTISIVYCNITGTVTFPYPTQTTVLNISETITESPLYLVIDFTLDHLYEQQRYIPIIFLTIIARLGGVMAAIWVGSYFTYRFNMFWFYFKADDSYYAPDFETRRIIYNNRKLDMKEYENQLIFSMTMGQTGRFGMQSHHMYEFLHDSDRRFHRIHTQMIVEDIEKFLTAKRIGRFFHEEMRVNRQVDAHYDIAAIRSHRQDLKEVMAKLYYGRPLDDEKRDVEEAAETNTLLARQLHIKDVEKTLNLILIQEELQKMATVCATVYPALTIRERLSEKLFLNAETATFSTYIVQDDFARRQAAAAEAAAIKKKAEEEERGLLDQLFGGIAPPQKQKKRRGRGKRVLKVRRPEDA